MSEANGGPLTILIIRHAEKQGGDWPGPGLGIALLGPLGSPSAIWDRNNFVFSRSADE